MIQGTDEVKRRELKVTLGHVKMECMEVVRTIERELSTMEFSLVKDEVKQEGKTPLSMSLRNQLYACGMLSDWVKPLESVRPWLGSSDQA